MLIQAFERRVLTYTPSNPPAFQVEMGNIGQHYYDWRYKGGGTPKATPTPQPTDTPAPAAPTATPIRIGGGALTVNGAGATFPVPIYTKWFQTYSANMDTNVRVQLPAHRQRRGHRSRSPPRRWTSARSDAPLTDAQLGAAPGLLHIPTVAGAVVVAYNLHGAASGPRCSTATRCPRSYLGDITNWNDPAIAGLNPGVTLPTGDIAVVHRSDGSGTTNIFTDYLSAVSADWKSEGRQGHLGQLAGGPGRARQRGRGRPGQADAGRHRLCRAGLRQAEQASPTPR